MTLTCTRPMVQTIAGCCIWMWRPRHASLKGINFGIIVLAVGFLLFRILPKTLRNRAEKVRTDIESARKVTEDAYARLSAIEAKLSGLDGEIEQIRAQVEARKQARTRRASSPLSRKKARASWPPPSRRWKPQPHRRGARCATLPLIWPLKRPQSNWRLRRRPTGR